MNVDVSELKQFTSYIKGSRQCGPFSFVKWNVLVVVGRNVKSEGVDWVGMLDAG
jgi:hypothetical protein